MVMQTKQMESGWLLISNIHYKYWGTPIFQQGGSPHSQHEINIKPAIVYTENKHCFCEHINWQIYPM